VLRERDESTLPTDGFCGSSRKRMKEGGCRGGIVRHELDPWRRWENRQSM